MFTGFVNLINHMGDDLMVVNAARVSFNKKSSYKYVNTYDEEGNMWSDLVLSEKDKKLIHYLAKNGHWTPFAHPQITLHIKAPFPIRTQFFKHKVGFVENEVSRRYVDEDPEFFQPYFNNRPDKSIKQGSGDPLDIDAQNSAHLLYNQAMDACQSAYKSLLNLNVAPEQARFVLPMGTYTEWWWTGSLSAYARFYKQRSDPHAQSEIRDYAERIRDIIKELFPVSWDALVNCDATAE